MVGLISSLKLHGFAQSGIIMVSDHPLLVENYLEMVVEQLKPD